MDDLELIIQKSKIFFKSKYFRSISLLSLMVSAIATYIFFSWGFYEGGICYSKDFYISCPEIPWIGFILSIFLPLIGLLLFIMGSGLISFLPLLAQILILFGVWNFSRLIYIYSKKYIEK